MNFVILNSMFFPVPRSHYLHVKKMATGFAQLGYFVIETNTIDSLLSLGKNDIVYISNHFYVDLYFRLTKNIQLEKLISVLEKIDAKILLWNFHTIDSDFFLNYNKKCLYLTESYNNKLFERNDIKSFYANVNYYQLLYSSQKNDLIELENDYELKFDFNFVGSPYNVDILNKIKSNLNYKSFIKITPPIINEIDRVNSFKFSKVNLVFHSESNKFNGVITERFAEALSYGNILFHDNIRINEIIPELPGCIYVDTYEDIIHKYNYYNALKSKDFFEIVKQNRDFWKNSPYSYRKQALNIINKFI